MAKQVKAAKDLFKHLDEKAQQAVKKFEENGGMCLDCGDNPGDPQTMVCAECAAKTEELLKQLRGPGFVEFQIPVERKQK